MIPLTRSFVFVMALVVALTTGACSGGKGPLAPSTPAAGDFSFTPNGVKLTFTANTAGNWNFGDGQTGSGQTVVHTFSYLPGEAKTYRVSFTPEGGGTVSKDIEVKPLRFAVRPNTKAVLNPDSFGAGYCLSKLQYPGMLVPSFTVSPGGTPIRVYLTKSDGTFDSLCRSDGTCRGNILAQLTSSEKTIAPLWPVEQEAYCVRMVNLSGTVQELNGSIDLEIPFQP